MTQAQNTAYQTDLTNFTAYWDEKLGTTTNELTTIDGKINSFYDKQISDAQNSYQKQIDAANAGYQQELTDFTDFWNQKLGISNTQLDTVEGEIISHYNQQESDVRDSYQRQIDATNQFYDDLEAANNAGLNAIRADRQASLDDLELTMLKEKVALEDAHDAGQISEEAYQAGISALQKSYNSMRSETSDHYRLQELEAEATAKTASVGIETDRTTALTTIKGQEADAITGLETQKNADLTTAQNQYSTYNNE